MEQEGTLDRCISILPAVNMTRIQYAARLAKLMTKDDLERELTAQAVTTKQRQLDALKERYQHAGQLDSAPETQLASVDCHKVNA